MNSYLHNDPFLEMAHYPIVATLMVAFMASVVPIWDLFKARRLRERCTSRDRLLYYRIGFFGSLALAAMSVWVVGPDRVLGAGSALSDMQRSLVSWPLRVTLLIPSVAFLVLASAPFLMSLRDPGFKEKYSRAIRKLPFPFLFPTNPLERRWFALLCLNAGLSEEIIFRSFLVDYFHRGPWFLSPLIALMASSVIFGLDHIYQGFAGILKTGFTGLFIGFFYFATGSLVLCMICHALVDLQILLLLKSNWADIGPGAQASDNGLDPQPSKA